MTRVAYVDSDALLSFGEINHALIGALVSGKFDAVYILTERGCSYVSDMRVYKSRDFHERPTQSDISTRTLDYLQSVMNRKGLGNVIVTTGYDHSLAPDSEPGTYYDKAVRAFEKRAPARISRLGDLAIAANVGDITQEEYESSAHAAWTAEEIGALEAENKEGAFSFDMKVDESNFHTKAQDFSRSSAHLTMQLAEQARPLGDKVDITVVGSTAERTFSIQEGVKKAQKVDAGEIESIDDTRESLVPAVPEYEGGKLHGFLSRHRTFRMGSRRATALAATPSRAAFRRYNSSRDVIERGVATPRRAVRSMPASCEDGEIFRLSAPPVLHFETPHEPVAKIPVPAPAAKGASVRVSPSILASRRAKLAKHTKLSRVPRIGRITTINANINPDAGLEVNDDARLKLLGVPAWFVGLSKLAMASTFVIMLRDMLLNRMSRVRAAEVASCLGKLKISRDIRHEDAVKEACQVGGGLRSSLETNMGPSSWFNCIFALFGWEKVTRYTRPLDEAMAAAAA